VNIYVGNLARTTVDEELRKSFEAFGQVSRVNIIKDNYSGDSRGFGFVEMPNQAEAEAAIAALNGKEMNGRELNVNVARPRENRPGGGGGRGGDRRGGGGGFGGPRGDRGDRGDRGGSRERW